MEKIRIGIDARLLGTRHRGIGRYTSWLLEEIISEKQLEVTAYVDTNNRTAIEQLTHRGIRVRPAPFAAYSVGEQIKFGKFLNHEPIDLVHFPHINVPVFCRKPYVVTVHDLILHHFPSRTVSTLPTPIFWAKYLAYRFVSRVAVQRAKQLLAVSHYGAEEVHTFFGVPVSSIHVIEQATELHRMKKLSYTKASPFILIVGAFYPHKNLTRLASVWPAVYKQTGVGLCFVGRDDVFCQALKKRIPKKQSGIYFLGKVTDTDLQELYQQCHFFLTPSLMEGCGLPAREALSIGASVVASSHSALPETCGTAATYIPVENDIALQESLLLLIQQYKKRRPGEFLTASYEQKVFYTIYQKALLEN